MAIGVGSGAPQAARISSPEITTGRQNRGDAMRKFYITRFTLLGQIRSRPHFSQTRNTTGETGRNSVPMKDSSAGSSAAVSAEICRISVASPDISDIFWDLAARTPPFRDMCRIATAC